MGNVASACRHNCRDLLCADDDQTIDGPSNSASSSSTALNGGRKSKLNNRKSDSGVVDGSQTFYDAKDATSPTAVYVAVDPLSGQMEDMLVNSKESEAPLPPQVIGNGLVPVNPALSDYGDDWRTAGGAPSDIVSFITPDSGYDSDERRDALATLDALESDFAASMLLPSCQVPKGCVVGTLSWEGGLDASYFHVREGPDYPRNGVKGPSLSALYEPLGMDLLTSDKMLSDLGKRMKMPPLPVSLVEKAGRLNGAPLVFMVNAQLPSQMPSLFSSSSNDPGVSGVFYFKMTDEAVDW
jgi:hypothetical protein